MTTAIEARGLTKTYHDVAALGGVSFRVAQGEIFGYLGRNGSGKTTTVRILTTLTRATSGTASVAGLDVEAEAAAVKAKIGVTMQDAALDPEMSGRRHLQFIAGVLGFRGSSAGDRIDNMLQLFELTDAADRRIGTYSGGMQRRLDLATALLGDPEVLFLDEPTTGLDPQSRLALWGEIRQLKERGTTVFLTTQYLEEADALADHIAIIDAGSIIATGTPTALKAEHGRREISFLGTDPSVVGRLPNTASVKANGGRIVVELDSRSDDRQVTDIIHALSQNGGQPQALHVAEATLEDVFLRLTGTDIGIGSTDPDQVAVS